jgi:hypothetical protein
MQSGNPGLSVAAPLHGAIRHIARCRRLTDAYTSGTPHLSITSSSPGGSETGGPRAVRIRRTPLAIMSKESRRAVVY